MPMTEKALWRLACAGFAVCCASAAVGIVLRLVPGEYPDLAVTSIGDTAFSIMVFAFPCAGILVLRRQPRNAIGWLMVAVGLLAFVPATYVDYGLRVNPGSLPAVEVVAALTSALWAPVLGLVGTFLLLLFPDGRLPSPRWRAAGWFSGASIAYVYLLMTMFPGEVPVNGVPPSFDNPFGVAWFGAHWDVVLPTIVVLPLSIGLCAAALVQRFRRARGVERLQLKWLATAAAIVGLVYGATMVASLLHTVTAGTEAGDPPWLSLLQELGVSAFVLIPIAIVIAILKHKLYEIEVVITKAVVVGTLAFFVTAVYIAIVVGLGSLAGRGDEPNLALSIAATATVAVAFQPVRERVQRLANRLVYGSRATPYEVLSNFADRVGGSYDAAQLLPMMARTVAQGVGATRVEVWLNIGSGLVREASWPDLTHGITTSLTDMSDLHGDRVVAVRHGGELLGAITVTKPASEPISHAEHKLLDDVAAQAGLVLRNVRLIEELRSSRQRLVTSQDEERQRLERNLHDGAQQSLISVALMIRTVRARLRADVDLVGPALDEASEQLGLAIEELRELARGIHPAILTERGLAAAIRSLAERSPVPVLLDDRLVDRPDRSVEAALYFVAAEGLANVAKYASASQVVLTVAQSDEAVLLELCDDGVGGADDRRGSGLRGLADRVAVLDGTLDVHSPSGGGTRLTCRIPITILPAPAEVADDLGRTVTPVGADR